MTEAINIAAGRKEAEEALELANSSSDGPWRCWTDQEGIPGWDGMLVIGDDGEFGSDSDDSQPVARVYMNEDAEFIADSRTSVPSLAEKLIAAYDEIEQLRSDKLSIDHLCSLVKKLIIRRSEIRHRLGSDADLRQQGELNMLNHVLDALDGGSQIEDWLSHS